MRGDAELADRNYWGHLLESEPELDRESVPAAVLPRQRPGEVYVLEVGHEQIRVPTALQSQRWALQKIAGVQN